MIDESPAAAIAGNRSDMMSGTTDVAAASMLATLPGGATAAMVTPAGGKLGSSPMGVAFETETGNGIYSLPRDHAMHHGDWYKGADGPFVGRSFIEFMWGSFDSAVGKDIPYDPSIAASRDTGLPPSDNFAKFIDW